MGLYITIISILLMSLFITKKLELKFEQSLFITLCLYASIMYLFGIFNYLYAGYVLCIFSGIVFGITPLANILKSASEHNLNPITNSSAINLISSLIYCIPFVIIFAAINPNYLFTSWDEFSFWGASVKILYNTNEIYNSHSALPATFKAYPPLQPIIQYLFIAGDHWREWRILLAHDYFILSGLLFAATTIISNRFISSLAFISATTFLYYFRYPLSNILVDQLLGVVFLCGLTATHLDNRRIRIICVSLICFVLVGIKQVGLPLALFVMTYNAIKVYFNSKQPTIKKIKNIFSESLAFFVAIILAFKSWGVYLSYNLVVPAFSKEPLLDTIHSIDSNRFNGTINEFFSRIQSNLYIDLATPYFFRISLLNATVLIILLSVLCVILTPKKDKLKDTISHFSLFLMWIAYLGFLLFCYLLFFTEYEGLRLAAFERYAGTFQLAWLTIIFLMVIQKIASIMNTASYAFLALMLIIPFQFVPGWYWKDIDMINSNPNRIEQRLSINRFVSSFGGAIKPGDKVYFIHQNSTGFEKNIFNYSMQPNITNTWCWTIGKKYFDKDVWTCDKKIDELLDGYNYLAIYKSDKQFWDDNKHLFKNWSGNYNESGLYKISKNNNRVELTKIK